MQKFYLTPAIVPALKSYNKNKFISDLVAGIIVAIIALPLSIALALASGASPQAGLYTAIAAGFVVAIFGGSCVQIAGPTAAFATTVAGILATEGRSGLFAATVMAGAILILLGVFKLGSLIKYIPSTVTIGFTSGIAITIFIGQIKDFLGLTYKEGLSPVETLEKLEASFLSLSSFSLGALIIGALSLAILIFYPKIEKRVPPSLVAVIVSVLLVKFIPALDESVFTIGELYSVPAGLPKINLGELDLSAGVWAGAIKNAVTIAVLAAIESLLSCVVADSLTGGRHNSNSELVGQGLANITSVFLGGIPATGAIARTAANIKNGGSTPIASLVHAIVLVLVLLFLMPLASLIPMPCIAAILFIVAFNMSEIKKVVKTIKEKNLLNIIVLLLTLALTVIFDLVVAIAVGLAVHYAAALIKKIMNK